MTGEMVFVLLTITCMVGGLVFEVYKPEIVVFFSLMIFMITGIVSTQDAIAGFSHPVVITIGCLFIIAGTIKQYGLLEHLIGKVLDPNKTERHVLAKMLLPLSIASAFFNNTPIVVTLTSVIKDWCARNNLSPSKFLIPISYITILGGTITILGTSTNLIVNGFLLEEIGEGFSIHHLGMVGIPITVLGWLYITTIGYSLLPQRDILLDKVNQNSRAYLSEFVTTEEFPFLNQTIDEAGLRNLNGLYLISIVRNEERLSPIKNTTKIKLGDHLIFTGVINSIGELQKRKGIELVTDTKLSLDSIKSKNSSFIEVVISHQSSLLYTKLKHTQFRAKYNAAVIAVYRKNERINSKIGDIVLKPGDTLLLITDPDFLSKQFENDFYVATCFHSTSFTEKDIKKGWLAIFLFLIIIGLVMFKVLPLLKASLILTTLYLLLRFVVPEQAIHHIKFNILLLLASSFGIGSALINSGSATWVANKFVDMVQPYGIIVILFSIYILTNIFTELVTNNAAAVIMFPIALEVASQSSIPTTAIAVIVAISASASFATPIGYQTNLIVYGAGGYSYLDYLKIGLPLNFIVMITTVLIVYFYWIY